MVTPFYPSPQTMECIAATRDTFKKRSPTQSSTLPDSEKLFCRTGESFEVSHYSPSPGGHWQVIIDGESWFIFDAATHGPASHWQCSWEQDDANETDDVELTEELKERAVAAQSGPRVAGLNLRAEDSFDTLVTPHFTYGEVTLYQEARRFMSDRSVPAAVEMLEFLEQLRAHYGGKPVRITSGHRPPSVNRSIGGATYSEHLFRSPGMGAIDFYVEGVDLYDLQDYCDQHWPHSVGYGAPRGFVHLGLGRGRVRWPY